MKVGARVRLREANTLYRHPNHKIFCHLVRASNVHALQLPRASDVYKWECTEEGLTGFFGFRPWEF